MLEDSASPDAFGFTDATSNAGAAFCAWSPGSNAGAQAIIDSTLASATCFKAHGTCIPGMRDQAVHQCLSNALPAPQRIHDEACQVTTTRSAHVELPKRNEALAFVSGRNPGVERHRRHRGPSHAPGGR
jgi:hypothetical protein